MHHTFRKNIKPRTSIFHTVIANQKLRPCWIIVRHTSAIILLCTVGHLNAAMDEGLKFESAEDLETGGETNDD